MNMPRTMTLTAIVLASLALFGAAQSPQPDIAGKHAAAGTVITVSGSGEVERKPDYAVVTVGVQVREESAAKAAEKAGSTMRAVGKALDALKLATMQLQTSGVSLNPAYSWHNDGNEQRQTLLGYDAVCTLRVRIEDPEKVGVIIDAAVDAGANRIHGISFELKGALDARQEALAMAAKAARAKADTLAAALGLRIVGVVSATTSSDDRPPWQPMMANEARMDAGGGLGQGIEPGKVTVRADASVTFSAVAD